MEPTKTTRSFRINDDIWSLLKKEAERRGTTASALVTQSITEHISGMLKKEGGLGVTDLINLIAALQQQTAKLAKDLDEAQSNLQEGAEDDRS